MKKLVFLFAMVFAVSMAMAQKTTWVDQSGNGNVADITQNACTSADATFIYAEQSGNWNSLTTMQTGNDNYLELIQSGANNTASMEQFTCDATANPGGDNTADIYQSGVSNTATLVQEEDNLSGQDYSDNVANAFQSGNNNSFTLDQGSAKYRPNSWSYLTQSGDGNDAVIDQIGYTQYSEIRQSGNWNTADLEQTGPSAVGWDESYSWQTGANNTLDINQDGSPSLELVESVQNGNSNTTNVIQSSWNVQEVKSKQKGTNDIINVTQIN